MPVGGGAKGQLKRWGMGDGLAGLGLRLRLRLKMAGKMVEEEARQREETYRFGLSWGGSAYCHLSECEEQGEALQEEGGLGDHVVERAGVCWISEADRTGELTLAEVENRECLISSPFRIWNREIHTDHHLRSSPVRYIIRAMRQAVSRRPSPKQLVFEIRETDRASASNER